MPLAPAQSEQLARPRSYQLVHVNNMPDFLVLSAWLPRLLGVPVIHDVHDLMPELYAEKFAAGETHLLVRALKLQERGFAVKAIRPPTVPAGSARLRLSLTARLEMKQLEDLVEAISDGR